jgi:hypothetical protein
MHLQVYRGEEKGANTRVRALARLASLGRVGPSGVGWGMARRWAQAHDVCVNSPPKSGPKPHRPATSFCHLFLLRVCVQYVLIEIDLVGYGTP